MLTADEGDCDAKRESGAVPRLSRNARRHRDDNLPSFSLGAPRVAALAVLGDVDADGPAVDLGAVERRDRGVRLVDGRHGDKAEAAFVVRVVAVGEVERRLDGAELSDKRERESEAERRRRCRADPGATDPIG